MDAPKDGKEASGDQTPLPAGPAAAALAAAEAASAQARDARILGLQSSRLLASLFMYVVTLAVLYYKMEQGGNMAIIGSMLRAALPHRLSPPCGLLPAKEFLIVSDRIMKPWGVTPGAGEVPLPHPLPACRAAGA